MSKRKQVKNACSNCQRACKKCDDCRPCSRCVKYHMEGSCVNSTRKERKRSARVVRLITALTPEAAREMRDTGAVSPADSLLSSTSGDWDYAEADHGALGAYAQTQHAPLMRIVRARSLLPAVPRPRGRPPKAAVDAAFAAFDALVRVCAETIFEAQREVAASRSAAQAPQDRARPEPPLPALRAVAPLAVPPRDVPTPPETPPVALKAEVLGAVLPRIVLPMPRLPALGDMGGLASVMLHAPRPVVPTSPTGLF